MSSIPHVIYFFWDRGKVLPDFAKKNIASWHKFFPDYLIREVDSTNFDINSVKVVRLAYEQKRFSYACDYIRLKTIYDNGGIYFDLDVEVIKDMRDVVEKGPFFGLDGRPGDPYLVNTGSGFAAEAGNPLIKKLMIPYEQWDKDSFMDNRNFPTLPACPDFNRPVFEAFGLKPINVLQTINGITFYPSDFFAPMDMKTRIIHLTENTRSIHHYTGRGQTDLDRWMNRYRSKLACKNGGKEYPNSKFKIRLFLFHPIKAILYHQRHRRRKAK
jgi:hypothetical protein